MRILITGGAGYLGAWLTREMLERGHTVVVFDRFCFGRESLDGLEDGARCTLVQGDIRRLQETQELFAGMDAVVHLASLSNDPSCDLDAEMAEDVNVSSTRELARLASENGVARFVLGSSCTVYGKGAFEWLDEQSPANPVSTFGRTKRAAEEAVLALGSSHFHPVVARAATMFGVSPRMRFDLAINHMVAAAVRQGRIIVRGGGRQWRPFVHVRDAARALALLAEAPAEKVAGEIFNTGSDDQNLAIGDLAQRVAAHIAGVTVESPKDDDDLRSFRVRFGKLPERLGFRCERSIGEGIAEVRKYLEDGAVEPNHERHYNVDRMKRLLATPVDEGGEPVATRFIPLATPALGPEEEAAVVRVLKSGWLTSGPQVGAFERDFRRTVGAGAAVAVCSCTAALHLCLVDMGVGPGDEVITSPITWASTANTIVNMGAKVVFADVAPGSLNIDPDAVERAITPRTKAIMPVHMAGHPADMDRIGAVAQAHGIGIVEDAAHALGATRKGTPVGAGARACFSFYAIKNITTMEGGAIAVADPEEAERLRLLATNGMAASAWDRYGRSAVPHPPEVVAPGFKYAMSNVSAAMGIEQLRKFGAFHAARKRMAEMYKAVLGEVEEIMLPEEQPGIGHAWHLFIIRFRLDKLAKTRDELAHALRRENIGTGFHFHGLHLHEYYRKTYGLRPEMLPEATRASREVLSLPLYPLMTDKNVHDVVTAVKKVVANSRRKSPCK